MVVAPPFGCCTPTIAETPRSNACQNWLFAAVVIWVWELFPVPVSPPPSGTGDLGRDRDRTAHGARQVGIVDGVGTHERGIRFNFEDTILEPPANIDLLRDAVENGWQGLRDRVQRDGAGQVGIKVDIDLGVSRQGKEQRFHGYVAHHQSVALLWLRRRGRGKTWWDTGARQWRDRGIIDHGATHVLLQMGVLDPRCGGRATRKESDRTEHV